MAGLPPSLGQPPVPGAPMVPGAMQGPPGQPIPQASPVGAPPPFGGGLGPAQASLQDALSQDISDKMSHAFQIIDLAHRFLVTALGTGQLYQYPDVLAHIRSIANDLKEIISKYAKTSGTDSHEQHEPQQQKEAEVVGNQDSAGVEE